MDEQFVQLPHSLLKDLEDINEHISSNVRALARGRLSAKGTQMSLEELLQQAQQLTSTIDKSKRALQGDDSWQRS